MLKQTKFSWRPKVQREWDMIKSISINEKLLQALTSPWLSRNCGLAYQRPGEPTFMYFCLYYMQIYKAVEVFFCANLNRTQINNLSSWLYQLRLFLAAVNKSFERLLLLFSGEIVKSLNEKWSEEFVNLHNPSSSEAFLRYPMSHCDNTDSFLMW